MPSPCTAGRGSVRAMRTIAAAAVIAGLAIPSTVVLAATKVPTYNLGAKGGTVKFSATVKNAKTCAWSSSPKVAGFNATVKCKTGKVSRSAKFKANISTKEKSYAITLTVRGKSTTVDHWKVGEAGKKAFSTTTTSSSTTTSSTSTTTTMLSGGGGGGGTTTTTSTTTTTTTMPSGGGTPTVVQPAPPLPTGAVDQGPLPSTTPLSVTVELNPTDPAGMQQMAQEVTDPSSPLFRHYLTSAEFTSMFGAPASAVSDVEDWATANGLSVTSGSSNQLSVEVSGTANALESAFGTSIDQVQLADGTDTYGNLTGPSMPSAIAGAVEAVVGLDDLVPPQLADLQTRAMSAAPSSTTGTCPQVPEGTYDPCQLASAYDFGGLDNNDATGFGERIAIVAWGAFATNDILSYQKVFPFQTPNLIPVAPGPTLPESSAVKGEVTLDVETAGALAPEAQIDVYEGPSNPQGLLAIYTQIANDNTDQVVSDSIESGCDSDESGKYLKAVQQQLEHMVNNGQEMLVASGDFGAEACGGKLSVFDPASQPDVTAVGGTSLTISADGQWDAETVWNDCNFKTGSCTCGDESPPDTKCASGGGISSEWGMPSWQAGPGVISNQIESTPCPDPGASGYCREVPDVSAAAGGQSWYQIYLDSQWEMASGTSAAAPLWAALAARLNDYCEGPYSAPPSPRLGFLNPVLYQIAANGEPGFHDITTGNNDYLQEPGFYLATPGYDMATGLGSPDATELAQSICGNGEPVISTDGTLSLPDATVGQSFSTELTTFDHRGGTWAVNAGSLPSGLSLSGYTISGTPTTPGSVSFGLMFTDTNDLTATVLATIVVSGASGGGSSWTAAEAPLPEGAARDSAFGPVACPSVGSCVATGFYVDSSGAQQGLIDTLSGGTWTAMEAPVPQRLGLGSDPRFVSGPLACPSVGSCVEVGLDGGSFDTSGENGLIDTLSGGTWTATEAPVPQGAAPSSMTRWNGLACPSVGSCVATGSNGAGQGLIDTLSGGTWTATEAPLPQGAASNPSVYFSSLACPAVGSCVATGSYGDSNGRGQGLIEMLSGGTWKVTEVPVPQGAPLSPVVLGALACPSVSSCVATGFYVDSNDDVQGLIDTLSGGTWTETEAPLPQGAGSDPNPDLDALACPSVGSCVATGSYGGSSNDYRSLIETLSGSTWTATEVPLPQGAKGTYQAGVYGLACPSVDSCVATGGYDDSSFDGQGLIEMLSGGTWTAAEAPLPLGAASDPDVGLESVACPSVGSCVATGGYVDSNGHGQGLIEEMG